MKRMSFRALTLFTTLITLSLISAAQSPRIVYSEPEREDSRRTTFEIIGKMNGRFLIYKSNHNEDAICLYDNDMKLQDRVKLEFTPDQQLINVDFVAYPDFLYVIYEYEKRGIVHCMAAKLDANAKLMMDPIQLDTTQVGFAGNNKVYTVINSDDKNNIMVFKINNRDRDNFVFTTLLYDRDLQLRGQKDRISMPMEERNDFFTDFLLTNDGELVFGKFVKMNSNDYISKLSMVVKPPDSARFNITNIELNGKILDEIKIKADNTNKRILLNSFYYKQKRGNIEGLYSLVWDKATNQTIRANSFVFSEDMRANAKGEDASVKAAFDDFFIKNIIIRRDGGYLLVTESEYNVTRGNPFNRWDYMGGFGNPWYPMGGYYYYPPNGYWGNPWNRWNSMQNTRYNADNIMLISVNKDGGVDWSNVIPKSQFDDESDNLVSFLLVNTGTDIHFLFNLREKASIVMLNDQSVAADGHISRNPTIKDLDRGYQFMTRSGKQVSSWQVIVPCLIRNYLCFARLEY